MKDVWYMFKTVSESKSKSFLRYTKWQKSSCHKSLPDLKAAQALTKYKASSESEIYLSKH